MSRNLKVCAFALLLVSLAAIAAADSHEQPPIYVWINSVQAQAGQGEALTDLLMQDATVLDPLVESGKALEWGIAIPVVHTGGDMDVRLQWVTFVGWDGMDHFMNGFMANMQTISEEERQARDAEWDSIVEPGSHRDQILRGVHVGKMDSSRPAYIHLSYWSTKPGTDGLEVFVDHFAPIFDRLVTVGSIQNYGLEEPAVHHPGGWDYMSWYMSSNLAARDAVEAAFEAAAAARSEEENKAWMEAMTDTFEAEHDDQILMVVHHMTAGPGGED